MAQVVESAPVKPKKSNPSVLVLLLLVAVAAAAGGWYWYHNSHKSKGATQASQAGWATYKNDQYGFHFDYPTSWGNPLVTSSSFSGKKIYNVNFSLLQKAPRVVGLNFFSGDNIKARLAQDKNGLIRYDDSSYAKLTSDPKNGFSQVLSINQMVSLKKIDASSVYGSYTIFGNTNCPTDKFSTAVTGCITETDYNNLNKVVKSLESI